MAQLFLGIIRIACNLPAAPVIGPLLLALNPVNPLNAVAFLAWLLGLKLTKAKWAKRFAPTWAQAAKWAALFYFVTMYPIYFVLLLLLCRTV